MTQIKVCIDVDNMPLKKIAQACEEFECELDVAKQQIIAFSVQG